MVSQSSVAFGWFWAWATRFARERQWLVVSVECELSGDCVIWVFLAVSGSETLKFADGRGSSCSFWFSPLTIGLKWRPSLHFGVINPFRENCGVFSVIAVGKYKVFSSDWFSAYCPGSCFCDLHPIVFVDSVAAGTGWL